jgi:cytochrome c oxidase assembly protein subunit 15
VTLRSSAWPHRLAVLTAAGTLVLIVAGGLVTNTGAALAVPDWPTTFGHNMFLFPWSQMVGGVFYEHSHRLLGALVGLLTLGLAAALWLGEGRRWVRGLGLLAVALVVVQGLLGGLRVLWLRDALAIVHGCLAQAFFALLVALAVVTSRGWRTPAPIPGAAGTGGTWRLALAAVGVLYLQIVLGALATHAGWANLHLAGAAVAVAVCAGLAGRVGARHGGEPPLARPAVLLGVLVALQVALGLGAYVGRFTGLAVPGGAALALALPVAHRVTASLLLGLALVLALRAGRRWAAGGRRVPIGPALASREAVA